MKENDVSGWFSAADCVDFYAADFGREVERWFHSYCSGSNSSDGG